MESSLSPLPHPLGLFVTHPLQNIFEEINFSNKVKRMFLTSPSIFISSLIPYPYHSPIVFDFQTLQICHLLNPRNSSVSTPTPTLSASNRHREILVNNPHLETLVKPTVNFPPTPTTPNLLQRTTPSMTTISHVDPPPPPLNPVKTAPIGRICPRVLTPRPNPRSLCLGRKSPMRLSR